MTRPSWQRTRRLTRDAPLDCHALAPVNGESRHPVPRPTGRILGYCLAHGEARPEDALAEQKRVIREFSARHAEAVPGGAASEPLWYIDHEETAGLALATRTAGRQLLAEVREHDWVIVAELALLARNCRDLQVTVELLRHIQATLVTCELGPISLTTPEGAVILSIMETSDRMRTTQLRTRGRMANRRRKEAGLSHLGPPAYGFRYEFVLQSGRKAKVEVPDPEERKLMRRLLLWVEHGQSYDQILERLNRGEAPNIDKRSGQPSGRPWSRAKLHGMVSAARMLRRKARVQQTVRAERAERSRTT